MRALLVEDDATIAEFVARGLREAAFAVDHEADGEAGLAAALRQPYDVAIVDLMLPRRDGLSLIEELRRRGAEVDLGVAYVTRAADADIDELRELIVKDAIDVVTFTSGSTVDNFFGKLTAEERKRLLETSAIASIGPTTTTAIRKYGRGPDIEAANATIDALHKAVVDSIRGIPA